jgi:hypothetical protein
MAPGVAADPATLRAEAEARKLGPPVTQATADPATDKPEVRVIRAKPAPSYVKDAASIFEAMRITAAPAGTNATRRAARPLPVHPDNAA